MATLLDTYMPYDAGPGANVTENGWRQFAKYFCGDGIRRGVANGFNTYGDSTGMQVKIDTGEAWIQGEWGSSTALKAQPIAAANPSQARNDLIVLRNDFVNNQMVLDALAGVPGSASFPALTRNTSIWEIQLAKVVVGAGVSTITAGNVTFLPQYTDGSALFRQNLISGSGQPLTTATNTAIVWNTPVNLSSAVHQTSGNTGFTFDRAGMWLVTYSLQYQANGTGSRWGWVAYTSNLNAQRMGQCSVQASGTAFTTVNGTAMNRFNVGDEIAVYAYQDSGTNTGVIPNYDASNVSLYWLGP